MNDMRSGDLIATLGRWGRVSGVAILAGYDLNLLAYECTTAERPVCRRTGRDNPKGVQAHKVADLLAGETAIQLSLACPLFPHEEDRLLNMVEVQLGWGPPIVAGETKWAGENAKLVADALIALNRLTARPTYDCRPIWSAHRRGARPCGHP
jgi:hypothetical protein